MSHYKLQGAIYFLLIMLISSCAGTAELPEMPEYNTRAAYPDLVTSVNDVEGDFTQMKYDKESLKKTYKTAEEYGSQLSCTSNGTATLSIVVTNEAEVDAPVVEKSLSPNCDKAAKLALHHLKFDEPAKLNGEPVTFQMEIRFKFPAATNSRFSLDGY